MKIFKEIPFTTKLLLILIIILVYLFLVLIFFRTREKNFDNPFNKWMGSLRAVKSLDVPIDASDSFTVIVDEDYDIFTGPGYEYEKIGMLSVNRKVSIMGISQDDEWLAIRLSLENDQYGWLQGSNLVSKLPSDIPILNIAGEKIVDNTPTPIFPRVIAIINSSIRSGPAISYEEIAILEVGQSAELIGRSQDNQWWVIKMPYLESGKGFVSVENVIAENTDAIPEEEIPTIRALSNVNIRSGPSLNNQIVGLLKAEESTTVLGESSDGFWWFVNIPESQENGWLSKDYVTGMNLGSLPIIEDEKNDLQIEIPTPSQGQPTLLATANVNIRSGPSEKYSVISRLEYGQKAQVVGLSPDEKWYAIRIFGLEVDYAWVYSDYVTVTDAEQIPLLE
jgi:uncharacterized protein YraI